jgi:hypothetical protein
MNNGCVCCTVRGDLIRVVSGLMKRQRPGKPAFDAIIVETTGLADPGPVAQTFFVDEEVKAKTQLDSVTALVDAKHVMARLDDSKEARELVAFADRIFLNKVDLATDDELAAVEPGLGLGVVVHEEGLGHRGGVGEAGGLHDDGVEAALAFHQALDAAPNGVEVTEVRDAFLALPGVSAVHDLHVWGLSTTDTALTAHLVHDRPDADALLIEAQAVARSRFGVSHTTFQLESGALPDCPTC